MIKSLLLSLVMIAGFSSANLSAADKTTGVTLFSCSPDEVFKGSGNVTVTCTVDIADVDDGSGAYHQNITFAYSGVDGTAINGTNYTLVPGVLEFDKSDPTPTPQTFALTVHSDVPITTSRTFDVILTNTSSASVTVDMTQATPQTIVIRSGGPTAVDDNVSGFVDQSIEIDVLVNDLPGDEAIDQESVTVGTYPTDGNLTFDTATRKFTFVPDPGWMGTNTFTYTVDDILGVSSNTATVTITYTLPYPDATDNTYVCQVNGSTSGNIIIDPPYDTAWENNLSVIEIGGSAMPANLGVPISTANLGTIVLHNLEGDFTYTSPGGGWNGEDNVTYTITNRYGNTDSAVLFFNVNNLCFDAINLLKADDNCTTVDENTTTGSVTSIYTPAGGGGMQYFVIDLNTSGVLDINLSNVDGQQILYYDFGTSCSTLFGKDTTSQLDSGYKEIYTSIPLTAGTYYLGLQGSSKTNGTDYSLWVNFRSACAGGTVDPLFLSGVGVNDPYLNYDVNDSITTKIVHKPFNLQVSYLNSEGEVDTYDGSYGNKIVHMGVIIAVTDDTCTEDPVEIGQATILHGDYNATATNLSWSSASKSKRIKTTSLDYGRLFREASGLNCGTSSLNSALCMVPACFNNEQNIRSVFPPAFQPNVLTCLFGDGTPGTVAPCDSNAYNGNCGGVNPVFNIAPAKYNLPLGCAMCLADAIPGEPCSGDNFAVRPNEFNSTITDGTIFEAGVLNNITFLANDGNITTVAPALNYNEVEETSFTADINISDSTKVCQESSIDIAPDINFTNGSVTNNYSFHNVGDFNMTIREIPGSEFAIVDNDDTADEDRYITPFNVTFKIIPEHFAFDGNLTDAGNNFTYLSNFELFPDDHNMSAPLQVRIIAEDLNGTRMTNYSGTCYAKDGNLTLNFVSPLLPVTPDAGALTKLIYYNLEDNTTGSIPFTSILSPFTQVVLPITPTHFRPDDLAGANDLNGTAFINYQINFDRNRTKVVNPIEFALSSIDHNDSDLVFGDDNLSTWFDKNATFYYGRVHAPRYRVNCLPTGTCTATLIMYYEIYDSVSTDPLLSNVSPGGQLLSVDDVRWYQNRVHDQNPATVNNDGDIDQYDPRNSAYDTIVNRAVVTGVNPTSSGQFSYNPVTSNRGFPFKVIMEINASNWLIYNKFNPTADVNQFELEFNSGGSWQNDVGTTKTGNDAETNTNRRIQW